MNKLRLSLLLLLLPVFAFGCAFSAPDTSKMNNVDFAKTVFNGMSTGDQGVQSLIDWEVFRAGNQNVGQTYAQQTSDTGKAAFRASFIVGFSGTAPRPDAWTNWGQISEDANWAVVSANPVRNPRATLMLTISKRSGQRRLAALDVPPVAAPSFQTSPAYQPPTNQ